MCMPVSTRHFFACFRAKDVCQPGQPFPPLSIICVLYFCIFGANAKIQNTNSNAKAQDCSRRILLLRYLFKSRVSATHVIRVDLSKESLQSLKARSVQQPSPSPTLRPWLNALQCIGALVILKKNQMQSLMKELCWIRQSETGSIGNLSPMQREGNLGFWRSKDILSSASILPWGVDLEILPCKQMSVEC